MHIKKAASVLFLALASLASTAGATVIGFDDIKYVNGDPAAVANGYEGFDWNNFWSSRATYDWTYGVGLVSGGNIGFMISAGNVTSFSSAAPFTFNGVNLAKMYYDGLTHFEGYAGNTLVYSKDVFSTHKAAAFASFDWTGLTRVEISVRDGSERVMFDNLTVNEQVANVPEPASISLVLAGLGLAGMAGKRRKKA